jgi:hypothetical protein
MSGSSEEPEGRKSSAGGEAAWKAAKEAVAARNADARRAAKRQRQAEDEQAAQGRADRDRREMADLIEKSRRQ